METLSFVTAPSGWELVVILLVFVLLFGAKKLPELGSSVGKSIKNFKKGINESKDEDELSDAEAASQAEVAEQPARKNST
ncbi:MAG TPA: twin-arginine translocase TatA/TatE family subunit [Egibacteraceae bacterium]|nr:twin-arginine translocase TatA/TatE family subunit [Egibacteraceae bacterium]